ncbi:MAG: STAS domain-containing protein [Lentisphaeria bacterium]|jgi:anti-anti-sigma regulatory factor
MNQEAQILVAAQGDLCQVQVSGRATFKIAQHLRDYVLRRLKAGLRRLILDFSECTALDSTFMGVLAMIGLEARGRCEVVFVNVGPANRKLLDGLGVSRLFKFAEAPVAEVNWQTLCQAAAQVSDMSAIAGTVLDAHQTLMALEPENIPKFQSVVEMLRAEVAAATPPKS